jgi:two-component system cell cycle sensor histidine kinase/response regulator CckA
MSRGPTARATHFGDTRVAKDGDTSGMNGSIGTVLVVDDQDVVRDVIRLTLERAGYTVLEAASPNAAIDLVRGNGPIDLLVTDVVMPEMDAFELADRIACEVPGVRILYTSGYTDAAAEGPFIQKPFTPAQLVEKVSDVLATTA